MTLRRLAPIAVALLALAVPSAGLANHVSIEASTAAVLKERTTSGSWIVRVSWSANCIGAAPGAANYSGNLYLRNLATLEESYLGGVFGPSGSVDHFVTPKAHPQRLAPVLKITCFEDGSLHGSGTIEAQGGTVVVPAHGDNGEGSADGTGGGSSSGSGGGDPTAPLVTGGCTRLTQGTDAADTLTGNAAGDVMFGYRGNDKLRGRAGADCLIGGKGNDVLSGEEGRDRLRGGSGNDTLIGGPGANAYDAGSGRDLVRARNGKRETIRCGSGVDTARVDRRDRVLGCEHVFRS